MASSESNCRSLSKPVSEGLLSAGALLSAWFPLLLAGALFFPTDPDLGYHLSIGRIIREHGFPHSDVFRTGSTAPEVAYSWLPDVVLSLLYDALGPAGLKLWLVASLLVLALTVTLLCSKRLELRRRWLLLFAASIAFIQFALPRPRVWALICFALLLLLLQKAVSRRTSALLTLTSIFALSALWANVHISVFLAPPVVLVFCVSSFIADRGARNASVLLAAAVLSAAAIALNPYYLGIYSLLTDFGPGGQSQVAPQIIELQGFLALRWPWPVWAYAVCALFAAWAALAAVDLRSGGARNPARLGAHLVAAALAMLSLSASRHSAFFAAAVVAAAGSGARSARLWKPRLSEALTGLGVAAIAVAAGWIQSPRADSWYGFDPREEYPVAAADSLAAVIAQRPPGEKRLSILTPFGTGHFLTFWIRERGFEDRAGVFLDGRTDALGIERFTAADAIYRDEEGLSRLEKQGIEIVIVQPKSELLSALRASGEWRETGGDARGHAFVRRNH